MSRLSRVEATIIENGKSLLRIDVYAVVLWGVSFLFPYFLNLGGDDTYLFYLKAALGDVSNGAVDLLRKALLVSLAFPIAALLLGRIRYNRGAGQRVEFPISLIRLRRAVLVIILISLAGQLAIFALIGVQALFRGLAERVTLFAGLNYFVEAGAIGSAVAPAVLYFYFLSRQQTGALRLCNFDRLLIACLLFISLTGAVCTGSKTTFAVPLLSGALLTLATGKLRFRTIVTFCVSFCALYFVWDKLLREYFILGEFVEGDRPDASAFLLNAYSDTLPALEALTVSMSIFGPQTPFLHGETYVATALVWVPRPLWANKPDSPAQLFSYCAFPNRSYGDTVPPGLLGEAWMNFGLAGVIVVSLLTFLVLRIVYTSYLRTRTPWALVRHTIFLSSLFSYLRGESLGSTVGLICVLVPNWFVAKMAVLPVPAVKTKSLDERPLGLNILSGEQSEAGFTAIELIGLVAILVVLCSLVMGASGKVRGWTDHAKCGGNLHQLGITNGGRSSGNHGYFPTPICAGHRICHTSNGGNLGRGLFQYPAYIPAGNKLATPFSPFHSWVIHDVDQSRTTPCRLHSWSPGMLPRHPVNGNV